MTRSNSAMLGRSNSLTRLNREKYISPGLKPESERVRLGGATQKLFSSKSLSRLQQYNPSDLATEATGPTSYETDILRALGPNPLLTMKHGFFTCANINTFN